MGKPTQKLSETIEAGAAIGASGAISHFPSLEGLGETEHIAANTQVFEGNGTPFLRVPGLKKLEAVKVGAQKLPLTEEREFPADASGKRFKTETYQGVGVQNAPDGCPVLLRSIYSNDGIWQKGARIYVTGEFEGATAAASEGN